MRQQPYEWLFDNVAERIKEMEDDKDFPTAWRQGYLHAMKRVLEMKEIEDKIEMRNEKARAI